MEYFMLEVSKEYIPPSLLNWYGKLDPMTLKNKKFYEMQKHSIFRVKGHMQMVYTDILMHPCFMVSREAMKVIGMYEPFIKFTRILLYDKDRGRSKDYYLPFLEEIDCLMEGSRFNLNRSLIHHAQIDGDTMRSKNIVRVGNVNCSCILVGQDLVESLLRRGMVGIGLRETETIYERQSQ